MCAKFRIDITKTGRLVRVCMDRRTWLYRHADHLYTYVYMYFTGLPISLFGCYKLRDKLNIPCSRYRNNFVYVLTADEAAIAPVVLVFVVMVFVISVSVIIIFT